MILRKALLFALLPLWLLPVSAQTGKSLVLDGCTNFFEIPDDDRLDYQNGLTIEVWISPNCSDGNRMIVAKEWCRGEFAYYLSVREQRLFYSFSRNGNCSQTNEVEIMDPLITPGKFHHVAVVHSQTDIKLFVDGVERNAAYVSGSFGRPINSQEPLRIGVYQGVDRSLFAYYSGLMDELRLWSSTLTATEINERINETLTGDEESLVLYLDMEEDESGENLILQNGANIITPPSAIPMGARNGTPYTSSPEDYAAEDIVIDAGALTCLSSQAALSIPNNNYKSVMWSNGDTGDMTQVTASGIYGLIVETQACRFLTDSVSIIISPESNNLSIAGEAPFCMRDSLTLRAVLDNPSVTGNYSWTLPDLGAAAGAELRMEEAMNGDYVVTFIDDNNCDTLTATTTIMVNNCDGTYQIPEVITPNRDGVNDIFRLFHDGTVNDFELFIFNRWGQEVFYTTDPDIAWDGTISGTAQDSGTYIYLMRFSFDGQFKKESGSFSLIR